MKLSELKTGEQGIIVDIKGQGSFRKRIIEMGFIHNKIVKVLLNAPLHDPVEYQIMGYEVSLRHSEAELIEVKPIKEDIIINNSTNKYEISGTEDLNNTYCTPLTPNVNKSNKNNVINIALVGNPNCGKTSLFNFASGAHERVGNYSGVTVDAKYGYTDYKGYRFELVDLPGTYSLSAYSPEELYVRKQLVDNTPDIVINVIDTSNLERNLYLTTQLIDMHIPFVCAFNMYDEAEKRGDVINFDKLSKLLRVPITPTVFKSGKGVKELFDLVIKQYENKQNINYRQFFPHIHINYGQELETAIKKIQRELLKDRLLHTKFSTRYLSIKLLENDSEVFKIIEKLPNYKNICEIINNLSQRVLEVTRKDCETAIMDAKYGFINGALKSIGYVTGTKNDTYHTTHIIDKILLNKYLGFPVFFLVLLLMFYTTFTLGEYPKSWLENGVAWLGKVVATALPEGPLRAMLADGIIGGVGAVIVFLPQILILYFFISYMEDCGYMSRAAFIMDKLMHGMGLHGKSFIPLIMGLGCNVPAIMATRTIESRKSRLITMLVLPMISCSARLPIYIMITGTFFSAVYRSYIMLTLYIIGILFAIILSRVFSKTLVKADDAPFVMELPPYRFPTWKAIIRHTWEKGKQYLKKMGGIILVASIIVWALGYFPVPKDESKVSRIERQEQSYIGRIGKVVEPIFEPQGFNWKLDVGLIAGVGAKEIVASTMGVLYSNNDSFSNDNKYSNDRKKYNYLRQQITQDVALQHGISYKEAEPIANLTAFSFLLFVLLYFPCIATVAAVKGETGSWKWGLFSAIYTTVLAWIVSAVFFQIGMVIMKFI